MGLPRTLDVRLLECLVALVSERSVTRASDRMSMSQPQMSTALRRLRDIFGDPLLVRSGQRLVPTARAIAIAAPVRLGLASISQAFMSVQDFEPSTSRQVLVIAMSDYISLLMLPKLMVRLRNEAPGIQIAVKLMEHEKIMQWLDDGDCDIAFGWFTHLNDRLRVSVVLQDNAVCIARLGHPEITGAVTLDQFATAEHALVAGTPSPISTLEHTVDTVLANLGLTRQVAVNSGNSQAIASIVAETDIIAVMSQRMAVEFARSLPLQLLPLPFSIAPFCVTMVWHERTHRMPAHSWLRTTVRSVFR